ncbi:MAG: hypothetical protein ABEH86_11075 [Haloarcula sp.]
MSAVGLPDVYRYGTRLLGVLLVVAGVGGGLIAVGFVLVQNGSFESLSATGGYRAMLGVVVGALGGLLLLSGLIGLFYKVVADATMAGVVAARPAQEPDTNTAMESEQPETGESSVAATETDSEESSTDATSTESQMVAEAEPDDPPTPTEPVAAPDSERQPQSEGDSEVDSGPGNTASPTAPADDKLSQSSVPDRELLDQDPAEEPQSSSEPQEWSPPDPTEFETQTEAAGDPQVGEAETPPDSEASGWDLPEAETADREPDDIETAETRLLDDATEPDTQHDPRTTEDLFGGRGTEDTPVDPSQKSTDDPFEEVAETDPDLAADDDAEPESTPADEGVTGFDTSGDDDPLSDPLDDE